MLLSCSPDGVIIACRDGLICTANKQAEVLFGYSKEELRGKALEALIPERFHKIHAFHFNRYFEDPKPREMSAGLSIVGRHRKGHEIPLELSLSPNPLAKEGLVIAFMRDIRIRKKAEESLRKLNLELEEKVRLRTKALAAANKDLNAFCYSVSHELRAPLTGISGFSQVLYEDYAERLDPEAKTYLNRIIEGSRHMEILIEGLLGLFRVTQEALCHDRLDLGVLADQVFLDLQARHPNRVVKWINKGNLIANGDPPLLRQALAALLENAWKYTAQKPDARIEFGKTLIDGKKSYYIRDNGCGFDMNYAEKLFTPFQRLHGKREFPGNGIGLATVKRIIQRHGGVIWGKGTPDQGATFYFQLP